MSRKILIASPFPPRRDAHHGGCLAIAHTVAELAQSNRVRILCLRDDGEPLTEPALARLCDSVEEIRRPGATIGFERISLMASSLAAGHPFWVGNWKVEAFRRRLREIALQWRPDVVHFESHVMAQYRDAVETCGTILVVHEPGASAARDRRRFGPGWQRIRFDREVSAWDDYERAILPRFDMVVCYSERDRNELATISPASHFAVITPTLGRMAGLSSVAHSGAVPPIVFFAGNFMHPPNVDAVRCLARQIFPRVRARCPGTILRIAGESPTREIRTFAATDIEITGRVPDMQPLLAAAAVVAIPLRGGAGVRIKTMEALCAGKAVIATALAAEGLGVRDGHEFVRAETDSDFVDAITALLQDPARRAALGGQAQAWGYSFCQPERIRAAYESLYAGLGVGFA
jgi:glycosyltransferase involved in cell wall biosynthesis